MTTLQFFFEDGKGNVMDENGHEPVQMEVDTDACPLDDVTDFNAHSELKPPEKLNKSNVIKDEKSSPVHPTISRPTRTHGDAIKERFFFQVYEKWLTAGEAAKLLTIPRRTAYNWLKKDQEELKTRFEDTKREGPEEKKKPGKKAILNANHKEHLERTFGDNPSTTVEQALEELTNQFEGLKVSKATVHRFMTNECAFPFKKAYFYPSERNSLGKIEERYDCVIRWSNTDLDFESNCVFLDESAFHINLKRTMAWSKKGERAIVDVIFTE